MADLDRFLLNQDRAGRIYGEDYGSDLDIDSLMEDCYLYDSDDDSFLSHEDTLVGIANRDMVNN